MDAPPVAPLRQLSRVLLVDDDPVIRLAVRVHLGRAAKIGVEERASGQEALDRAREVEVDLLLLDVDMPGLDGRATLRGLRERGVTAPAVFFTADPAAETAAALRALGAADVLAKPFDLRALTGQLEAAWRRHQLEVPPAASPP